MSNRHKIMSKGNIRGGFAPLRDEVAHSLAWKHTSPGARLLYLALRRRLGWKLWNNGRIYLSTRKAAKELGSSQKSICIWFAELEHYGFIIMTEPGCIGPKGKAAHWRLTDEGWGELDGKEIQPIKNYLKWDGTLFERRPQKTEKRRIKYVRVRNKIPHTADVPNTSGTPSSDVPNTSYAEPPNEERNTSYLE
jgi:hypothetical protein